MIRAGMTVTGEVRFAPVRLDESMAHVVGRQRQLSVELLARVAGSRVEQIAGIRTRRRVRGKQADVRVDARGSGVVIPCPEVDVTGMPSASRRTTSTVFTWVLRSPIERTWTPRPRVVSPRRCVASSKRGLELDEHLRPAFRAGPPQ